MTVGSQSTSGVTASGEKLKGEKILKCWFEIPGGGSAGCNTLYQLARRGVRAVLLEKARLTAGTTWHTAGLIWRLRPNDVEIQLLGTTRDLLMRLEAETGIDPGWINNGGLFIAHSKVIHNPVG